MDRWILAFLAGHITALFCPLLLPINLLLAILFFASFLTLFLATSPIPILTKVKHKSYILKPINGFVMGAVYVMLMANLQLANSFVTNENHNFHIKGKVSSVVVHKKQSNSVTFSIKVEAIDGMPVVNNWYLPATHIRANWFKPSVELQQGDELLTTIKLNKPHGYQNTFGFDFNQWLFAKGFVATGNIKIIHSYLSHSQKNTQQKTTNKLIDATTGLTNQGIILAVGLGNRSLITTQQFELYNHMGISHLLAISGLHIGIIFLVMKLLIKWLANLLRVYISYTLLQSLVLLLLWAYISLINFPISATRAGLFVTLWVLLNINFNNINKIKLLLLVALFSLLIDPFSVLTAAWWLTFSAVLGIILFTQKYPLLKSKNALHRSESSNRGLKKNKLQKSEDKNLDVNCRGTSNLSKLINQSDSIARVVTSKAKIVITSAIEKLMYLVKFQVFITIWMMPVVIFWFGGVSVSGVLTNLIAIPLFSFLLVPCIFIGTLLVILTDGTDSLGGGSYVLTFADKVLNNLLGLFSHYPVFHYWVDVANGLWFYVLLLILIILVLPVYFLGSIQRPELKSIATATPLIITVFILVPIIVALFPWQTVTKEENDWYGKNTKKFYIKHLQPRLTMYLLDVGQGTSILFQQGTSGFIYDLGPVYPSGFNATQAVVKPMLVGLGITEIDHIVISHNDSDHIGNIDVLGDAKWVARRLLTCPQQPFTWLNAQVEILWPPLLLPDSTDRNDISELSKNDSSCVVKITDEFTGFSVLLTGDITSKIERRLLIMAQNNIINLKSDILISAHHGSKYSSAMKFINTVEPIKVLHSAGVNNRFGFPTQEVISRFYSLNQPVQQYSTNDIGMIKVIFSHDLVSDDKAQTNNFNTDEMVTGYLNHWQPFWKKQNPFRFTSEIR